MKKKKVCEMCGAVNDTVDKTVVPVMVHPIGAPSHVMYVCDACFEREFVC